MELIKQRRPGLSDYSTYNYRLTQDWEVPDWIKVKPVDKENEKDELLNLGKRQRKTVINMDNLSEAQFLKAIEEGEDVNEVIKKDNLRREKRIAEGRLQSDYDDEDEELP